ncbi:MAG: DUF4445 domain-containing protein [Synergistaceae bacterium]|nr:DUF4445 domain-containing protein [Synergistaceae bacterium]
MTKQDLLPITFLPSGTTAWAHEGETLFDVAARAGVPIARPCGGAGVCGKCRVRAHSGLAGPTETERRLLDEAALAEGVRLACAAVVTGAAEVTVIDGATKKSPILAGLASEITDWAPDASGHGIAVDIGTTTVVTYLLDLEAGRVVDAFSFLNPQIPFGDDVISRIAYSSTEGGLKRLQAVLIDGLNGAFAAMTAKNGLSLEAVTQVTIAANTVVQHLFAGVSPQSIGVSPYEPAYRYRPPLEAASLGLKIAPGGQVKLLPNVAGYVGSDIVAGVAATAMADEKALRLLIDIGTNNEIVLGNRDGLYCCAAAAGPAFEGARVGQGMRAADGAIERVLLVDDHLVVETIGDEPPRGICGSGLVDVLALLVQEGVIDRRGRMADPDRCDHPAFADRLDRDGRGIVRLLLTDRDHPVYFSQKDVRELQLALGAIRVGVEVLLEHYGATVDAVDEIFLAGAFGNYIDHESAVAVGLLPPVRLERIRSVRNTAGLGAVMALASASFFENTRTVAERMTYIELSSLSDFQKRFVGAMFFEKPGGHRDG